jgi:hypothetical protein
MAFGTQITNTVRCTSDDRSNLHSSLVAGDMGSLPNARHSDALGLRGTSMTKIDLNDDEIFALQAAVEHLRGGIPDDSESRERRVDAAFRIASKLEQITRRALSSNRKSKT